MTPAEAIEAAELAGAQIRYRHQMACELEIRRQGAGGALTSSAPGRLPRPPRWRRRPDPDRNRRIA